MNLISHSDRRFYQFMETPLAELEEYGVDYCTIDLLEQSYGIYIKDLVGVDPRAMKRQLRNFGDARLTKLRLAMDLYWRAIQNGRA